MQIDLKEAKHSILEATQKPLDVVHEAASQGLRMTVNGLLSLVIICSRHKLTTLAGLAFFQLVQHMPEITDKLEEELYEDTLEAEVERNTQILNVR